MQVPSASGFPETAFSLEDLLVGNPAETIKGNKIQLIVIVEFIFTAHKLI
jgi:hypothetical protein